MALGDAVNARPTIVIDDVTYDLVITPQTQSMLYGYIETTDGGWVHEIHHPDGRIERFCETADGLYEDNP